MQITSNWQRKCFLNIPLGQIKSSNRLCFAGLYHLRLKQLSQTNAKKAFWVTHCCGLYTLHYLLNRGADSLFSWVLHGSNCSDLNEFNPCTYQYKYKKSWTDHRNSFLKFKKRLCFSALIGCGYRSICMLQLWSEQIHSCIQTVTHQSRLIWAHRGNWWASSGVSDLGEECVVGGCKPGHAKAGTWRAGKSQQKNWNDFVWLCIDTLTLNFRRTLEQSRDKASKKPVKIPKMSRAGWGGENCGGLWLPYSFLRFSG